MHASTVLVASTSLVNAVLAADCVVNAAFRDEWVEAGLTRFRTVFSAKGTDVAKYCDYWNKGDCMPIILPGGPGGPGIRGGRGGGETTQISPFSNIQCGFDDKVDGGTWRVDVSAPRGLDGDNRYWKCLGITRDQWIKDTGCKTG